MFVVAVVSHEVKIQPISTIIWVGVTLGFKNNKFQIKSKIMIYNTCAHFMKPLQFWGSGKSPSSFLQSTLLDDENGVVILGVIGFGLWVRGWLDRPPDADGVQVPPLFLPVSRYLPPGMLFSFDREIILKLLIGIYGINSLQSFKVKFNMRRRQHWLGNI